MTRQEIFKLMDEIVGSRPEAIVEALDGLAAAAGEAARHVEETWASPRWAREWGKIAGEVGKTATKVSGLLPFRV